MLEQLKKFAGLEILIAIASAVFGLLVSPILDKLTDPLFDTPTRAILISILFLSFLTITATIAVGVFAKKHESNFSKVGNELSVISQRLGLTVRFVHDPPKHSNGDVYKVAREIIEKAEKEIIVLYYARPRDSAERQRGQDIETEAYRNERIKYTQSIFKKSSNTRTISSFTVE